MLSSWRDHGLLYRVFCIIGLGIILVAVCWALGHLKMAIATLLVTCFFVFILHRLVDFFQKKGVPRGIGVLIGYVICFGIAALLLAVIGPMLWEQIANFINAMPGYIQSITDWSVTVWDRYGYLLSNDSVANIITNLGNSLAGWAADFAGKLANGIINGVAGVVSGLIVIIMSCCAAWWMLVDYHEIGRECKVIVGPKHMDNFMSVFHICGQSFGGYLKGVSMASICTGILAFIGFSLIGLPYPLVLALVTALMNFVPVLGPWIGGIFAALIGITVGPLACVLSIVVTVAAQQITDNLITPRIMSDTVALHPALVIIAIAIGSSIGGVLGMVFAVPLAAIAKGVYAFYFEKRTGRQLLTENGAFFRKRSERKRRHGKGAAEEAAAGETAIGEIADEVEQEHAARKAALDALAAEPADGASSADEAGALDR